MTGIAIGDAPRHGPFSGTLDPQSIAAYARATCDHTTAVLSGDAVPVVFPVVLVFQAQQAANADIPGAAWRQATGGVHGEHDIVLHRALEPGEVLQTWSRLSAARTTRAGTSVVLYIEQFDSRGALVAEQWWTTMLLGLHGVADIGAMPADHRIPDGARARPLGSRVQHIDSQVAHRYAEVSGDWSAHHFDIDAARRTGFDFLFGHGLCTMAICTHQVLALAGVDHPGCVRRAAVRFAAPTPLGADLTVSAFGIDDRSIGFEAACDGTNVITHGRLELRDS
ncbi:MaoC/PaaZ C-terminal domain-containing protein [Mycobacterium sp. 1081908.1]|uniref:MaoC/PaaZ C-terminal domain-containing protein n=1 Tax=Mycobacterium sp. 1081908.1 TaxID=1834066 RepID=UPI0007FF7351|nr:MaoC/PaaZ C-terminal domain-containing protein [Mycobacterium sp. 1081908.1]OBK45274.1 acyl dehydratase [Mycobacterium sp. 1081908.1]